MDIQIKGLRFHCNKKSLRFGFDAYKCSKKVWTQSNNNLQVIGPSWMSFGKHTYSIVWKTSCHIFHLTSQLFDRLLFDY